MKMTQIALECIVDQFLFAAENGLHSCIVDMSDTLCEAQDQCLAVTGKAWYQFVCECQDRLENVADSG